MSSLWKVAVTYYLSDQTLDRKVTLKICGGIMFYEQLKTDMNLWIQRNFNM